MNLTCRDVFASTARPLRGRLAAAGVVLLLAHGASAAQSGPDAAQNGSAQAGSASADLPVGPAVAATGSDWPCVQRRAGTISPGVVWTGPDPAQAGPWDKDFEAAALAQKLASRRTPFEDVDGLLDEFAQKAGADKSARLTRVFAGVLELINAERNRILLGIGRYARGQDKLAQRVRLESDKVSEVTDGPNGEASKDLQDLQTALKWDRRIFEERGRSLTYVCETPVILEKRVFELARRIQQRL